jgi:hypothetical protein
MAPRRTPDFPDLFRVGDALDHAEALIRSAVALLDEAEHILNQTDERLRQATIAVRSARSSISN